MNAMPAPRRKPIVCTIVGIGRDSRSPYDPFRVSVTFTYRQDEPHSVAMDISLIDDSMPGEPPRVLNSQRWEFARSLLAEALTGRRMPTLIGDVRVSVLDSCTAQIRLIDPESGPDHPVTFDMHLDLPLLRKFIKSAYADVPAGDETLFLDVDGLLAELFGDDRHRSSGA